MSRPSLEEAGRLLEKQREALWQAEAAFRSQYEEVKLWVENHLEQARASIAKSELTSREKIAEAEPHLRAEIEEAMKTLWDRLAATELEMRGHLETAARIIDSRLDHGN